MTRLAFLYEEKGGKWVLFIHLSHGAIQISGDKKHGLRDTVYVSPIIETVPKQTKHKQQHPMCFSSPIV